MLLICFEEFIKYNLPIKISVIGRIKVIIKNNIFTQFHPLYNIFLEKQNFI